MEQSSSWCGGCESSKSPKSRSQHASRSGRKRASQTNPRLLLNPLQKITCGRDDSCSPRVEDQLSWFPFLILGRSISHRRDGLTSSDEAAFSWLLSSHL